MYHRNSSRIDVSESLRLSLMLVHAIFLFHFSPLTFLLDFYPSFSRARFRLLLLERPTNHRCDPFEFSCLKLLYTFSCSKVLDSPPISAASSDTSVRNVTTLLHRSYLQCCYFEILTTEPRAYPRPISLDSSRSNRSTRNTQLTSFLRLFLNNFISPFF